MLVAKALSTDPIDSLLSGYKQRVPEELTDVHPSKILQARDWEQLREYMQRLLSTRNICDFMLKMNITSSNGDAICHLFGTLPISITNFFNLDEVAQSDPINHHLAKSNLPLTWQLEQQCSLNAGQAYPLLKERGICHGSSVAIRSERAVSRVDFYSNLAKSYPDSITRHADILLLGTYIHEAAELIWRKTAPNQTPLLSARELECLKWSFKGKTSRETGLILGVTEHTVYFHLKNAATKLGAHSTRDAIIRAITVGIISK